MHFKCHNLQISSLYWAERTMGPVHEEGCKSSNTVTQHLTAASFADDKCCTSSHSFNLPTVHCAQRSEFNTMANTLHYQLQHAWTEIFSYPRASENFSDVSQKRANQNSSSIRTMKRLRPIGAAEDWALPNGERAPPRVMLSELKTEDTAYRLCSLIHSHCRALRFSDSQ